ncbi:MAG: glycoside hydrolase family 88 protein [Verrucomicrobiaceae bacterium]|jgi:unsaturated rhamnogalacturonyl hydrolase|nr:glycoside hydrolase family 88 protein [Verrucomicrobiaceae bacterium]
MTVTARFFATAAFFVVAHSSSAELEGMIRSAVGVTRAGTPIPCLLSEEHLNHGSTKHRVLLVGGLDGSQESVGAVTRAVEVFRPAENQQVALSAVPDARPGVPTVGEMKPMLFPPAGNAYNQPENDMAHYLWRWIGMYAPDAVVLVAADGDASATSLAKALGEAAACGTGTIPCIVSTPADAHKALTRAVVNARPSAAWLEIRRRVARSAATVAMELAEVYGHKLDPVAYIPALAVIGRMRLGELTGDDAALRDAEKICVPYKDGGKESMPANGNGSTISGHLVFAELARRSRDAGWTALVKKAADHGFDAQGLPKESMPFHSEMSDSVFMGCAILAEAGALTGEKKYFEHCLRHLRFMEKRCLRADGIYRHSPLDESAWGRGNGFPALGLSLSLSQLPPDSAEHAAFLQSYHAHLAALKRHQDPTGAWHQVIDHEESYREFTSTCMITFAIVRGLRRGWLEAEEWQPVVDKAWTAIKSRIGPDGQLVDVCTGTGKMNSLRDYLDRTAILGRDDRGGAMALMVATEIAFWEKEKAGR